MKRRTQITLAAVPGALALGAAGWVASRRMRNPYYRGPASDHFDGLRFASQGPSTDKTARELVRWRLAGGREEWPASYPGLGTDRPPQRSEALRVVLIGHASLLIQVADVNILVDPVFSERASPFRFAGPRRVNPPGIAFEDLPPIDAILITHNHYDHLDIESLGPLWRTHRSRIAAPLGNDAIIRTADQAIEVGALDWGEGLALSERVSAHLVPAYHWSARWLRDRRMALWGGFVIGTPAGPVYVAGDTAFGDGSLFRAVRERFGAPRLAILPIGAYEPRWFMENQHMNPDDAVRAMLACGAPEALGVHWGTFRLTDEGVERPLEDLAAARDAHGIAPGRFAAMRPGQVWSA